MARRNSSWRLGRHRGTTEFLRARAHLPHGFDVRHADWLAAAGIIGDDEHHERNFSGALGCDQRFEGGHERLRIGFGDRQVHGPRTGEFNIGAGAR
jgi:hypothetical protein